MNKNTKEKLQKYLKKLVECRQIFANAGMVGNLQATNYEIARVAKKLDIDYYSIA